MVDLIRFKRFEGWTLSRAREAVAASNKDGSFEGIFEKGPIRITIRGTKGA